MSAAKLTYDHRGAGGWFQSERIAPLWTMILLGAFGATVAALGGSSRPDILQTAFVRPLVALYLVPACYLMDSKAWRQAPMLIALLAALAFWMGLQLVPLPPTVWQELPDRQLIAELDQLIGLEDQWRPLSLAPTRGVSALIGLVVPLAAVLLALACRTNSHLILNVIVAIGIINALLGFAQLATGSGGPLYLYHYAPTSSSFGLFANRNHGAVFSVVTLVIVARLMGESYLANRHSLAWTKVAYPLAFAVLLMSVLVTGSRTAFFVVFFALGACSLQAFALASVPPRGRGEVVGRQVRNRRELRWVSFLLAALALSLIVLFVGLERAPAVARLMEQDPVADLRWKALPILQDMARVHWLWGSGFGSFDMLYQTFEPNELLMVAYFNQAHNDWLQIVIEGGLPACLLIAGLLAWVVSVIGSIMRSEERDAATVRAIFWITILLVIGIASVSDYPLRTPIFQAMGAWLLVCLVLDRQRSVRVDR